MSLGFVGHAASCIMHYPSGAFHCYQIHNPKPKPAILISANTTPPEKRFVVYIFYKDILQVNLSVSEDFLISCS
jgi:hypothetical protein